MLKEGEPMRRGFTLIELLVVIAIIAILAAILFPVFAKAREKARQSSCLSNVKQIALAILQYAQDYDEGFPNIYQWNSSAGPYWGIIQDLDPYIKSIQVHDCPSADMKSYVNNSLGSRSYGYHLQLFPSVSPGAKMGTIVRPAEIVMMGDVVEDCNLPGWMLLPSQGAMKTNYDGSNCSICGQTHNSYFPNHGSWQQPGFNVIERHNGTANIGFCDGHAKAMKHSTLYNGGSNAPYFNYTQ
jgi:prepilin-type N-terminal cleavage/methylation domain-containing protein/prepilin-type processing-associated H-X9-DG protein